MADPAFDSIYKQHSTTLEPIIDAQKIKLSSKKHSKQKANSKISSVRSGSKATGKATKLANKNRASLEQLQ